MSKKNNSPSPATYRCAEALDKTTVFNKTGVNFKIAQQKKEGFCEVIARKKKTVPGVGRYDAHLALDKVSRPMKSKGY